MKKRLLLITAGFPYGESERGFLDEEVRHLAEAFDLSVLAMDTGEELIHPTAGIRRLERYSIPSARRSLSAGMLCNLLHPSNALYLMVVILSGISMLCNSLHPVKVHSEMDFIFFEICTDFKSSHPENA